MNHLPYAKLMRNYREKANLTLRQLSECTFFGFQTLSKYEIELIPLSNENFEVIAKCLDIQVDLVYYINAQLENDLNQLYECIVFDYTHEISEITQKINRAKIYIPLSDLYHYTIVLMFALDIIDGKDDSSYLNEILLLKNQIDSKYMQIFYDYYAININRKGQLAESIELINRALSLGNRSLVSGMIHYHAGLLYSLNGNLKISLEHNLKAEHQFIQEHNHIRLMSVQTNIATIYARQNEITRALEIYNRLLKEALRSNNFDIEIVTKYNIAWCYRKMSQFIRSNEILHEIKLKSNLSVNGYYILASNYNDLNEHIKAEQIIKSCLKQNLEPLFQLKFELLEFTNQELLDERYSSKLKDFLVLAKSSFDYENTEFVLDKLIEYYEMKYVYKTANIYLKEKLALLEHKFSH